MEKVVYIRALMLMVVPVMDPLKIGTEECYPIDHNIVKSALQRTAHSWSTASRYQENCILESSAQEDTHA
jgi:hypothetical protein